MKSKYLCIGLLLLAVLTSCDKEQETNLANFDVEIADSVYTVGDTVTFNLKGNPLQITFYSGEDGSEYEYRKGRVLTIDSLLASFSTNVAYGKQRNLLSAWVSTDFNGKYTIEDIRAATWKNNITKDFALANEDGSSTAVADAVSSGIKDLLSEAELEKPLYFAFRYKKKPDTDTLNGGGVQRNWLIRDFLIEASTEIGKVPLITGKNFNLVYDENFHPDSIKDRTSGVSSSTGLITLRAPSLPNPLGDLNVEVWAVSSRVSTTTLDGGTAVAVPIKGYSNLPVTKHTYIYSTPGRYKVTFVGSNQTANGSDEVVKQVVITVKE